MDGVWFLLIPFILYCRHPKIHRMSVVLWVHTHSPAPSISTFSCIPLNWSDNIVRAPGGVSCPCGYLLLHTRTRYTTRSMQSVEMFMVSVFFIFLPFFVSVFCFGVRRHMREWEFLIFATETMAPH